MRYETLRFIFENYKDKELLVQYYDFVKDKIVYRTTKDLNSRNPNIFLGILPSMFESIISVTVCETLEKIYNHNHFGEFIINNGTIKKISEEAFKLPETSEIELREIQILDSSQSSNRN